MLAFVEMYITVQHSLFICLTEIQN